MDYGNDYSTSYRAQGAADGGGFVSGDTQSSQTEGKGGWGKDTLRPVTVKQLLGANEPYSGGDFKIDGSVITQVTFVGQIRGINTQTTNTTYQVDDGTGIMDVKQWLDIDSNEDQMDTDSGKSKLVENAYCRVYGRLKEFNSKRHVAAHVIKPITDYNEINYHLLEATAVHLFFTRGPPHSDQSNGDGKSHDQKDGYGMQQDADGNSRNMPNMSSTARRVYSALRNAPETNEGMNVQVLATSIGMAVNDVYKGAEELVSLGLIFTTVDDETWAVLDY